MDYVGFIDYNTPARDFITAPNYFLIFLLDRITYNTGMEYYIKSIITK